AIDRSLDGGDAETAGRITWAMWLYWWLRGQATVGRRRAEQCIAADLPSTLLGRVRLTAATMSYAAGDLDASAKHWVEAYRLGSEQNDPEVACKACAGTGLAALGAGDLTTASTRFREALPLGDDAGEAGIWLRSLAHVWLGTVLMLQSDHAAAVVEIQRGLELARGRGDRLSTYIALYNLSQAAIAVGDHALARRYLEEGIELSEETQDMANLAYFLEALAVVESADEQSRRVAGLLGAAQALRETVGANVYAYYLPDESLRAAAEQAARAALGEDAYDDAVDAGRAMEPLDAVRFALNVPV
ncbi:MAG: tetratricopeptide repeat protein, partial [Nocardioidaceae bacterium]